jgi:hypothetical protein
MRLVPIEKIPAASKKKLQKFIDDFVKSEVPRVEIIYAPSEYRNSNSCYSSFYMAAKRSGYRIRVTSVGDRTFMENLTLCHEK